jgi:hypothetical protein
MVHVRVIIKEKVSLCYDVPDEQLAELLNSTWVLYRIPQDRCRKELKMFFNGERVVRTSFYNQLDKDCLDIQIETQNLQFPEESKIHNLRVRLE